MTTSSDAPVAAPVLIAAAVPRELAPLTLALEGASSTAIGRSARPGIEGTLDGRRVLLVACGVGKAPAAATLAATLETRAIDGVIGTGVCGAYPGARLRLRDVVVATEEVFADEGVETPTGWQGFESFLDASGAHNRVPLDLERAERIRQVLGAAAGPMATVSTGSGTDLAAARMHERWHAIAESMEGAALALVARRYGVPFVELRAVSNFAQDRDPTAWDLDGAITAACAAVRRMLSVFP